MAQQINRLNARKLPTKAGLHADGNGLYLAVKPTGAMAWSFIYNFNKKRREKGLGPYPTVSLAEARAKVRELRAQIQEGTDPLAGPSAETFGQVAEELITTLSQGWKSGEAKKWRNSLGQHASTLMPMSVSQITTDHVLEGIEPIWVKTPIVARRVRARIEKVLDAAKVRGLRSGENPARWSGHLEFLLPKQVARNNHHTALPYPEVPAFVKLLRERQSRSARALEFLILTASRMSNVVEATWDEFDIKNKLWTIPAERMKMGKEHRVPLTPRMIELVEEQKPLRLAGPFTMGKFAIDSLLERMNDNAFTIHGFRSSFRDWAGDETDAPREVAEAALAHRVGNEVERAYRRGDALAKRRELMEEWEAYVCQMK